MIISHRVASGLNKVKLKRTYHFRLTKDGNKYLRSSNVEDQQVVICLFIFIEKGFVIREALSCHSLG